MLLDGIKTIDSFSPRGKRILLRLDLNSPVDRKTGRIEGREKIVAASRTLRELLEKGASVAVIAHQGRPGGYDFISLEQHSRILGEAAGADVRFVPDICGKSAADAIHSLSAGHALVLDNVRGLDYEQKNASAEEHSMRELVTVLSPLFDYFVNDAFAAIHRAHCSMVGFTRTLPSSIGRLMQDELSHISGLLDNPERPAVYVFGGKKFSDFLPVLNSVSSGRHADSILLSGLLSVAFLVAKGVKADKKTRDYILAESGDDFVSAAEELLESSDRIYLPTDLAFNVDGRRVNAKADQWIQGREAWDIGDETISRYSGIISSARTVFISGPAGVYEKEGFGKGTSAIFRAATEGDKYSIVGGGHTASAVSSLGFTGHFSYVSTGGGALEALLSGKKLDVLEDLRRSAEIFSGAFR
ncbi:MAG: phosphoglycerate kinase [Candidatus Thermoplasmatota archaeon]|jgi:phosphoglycerate kinase|nr:phosphoglycerate kinase [Candidatus Sysuiplasma jiujiangense]MCL4316671.1 phosphoglycerate kinase [Candidatus Thermoplasmatota archaeon]